MQSVIRSILVLFFCICALNAQDKELKKHYHFVSIENLIEQEVGREVIPKIYRKLALPVTISPKPAKRAQAYVVTGKKDGEIMRIWSYGSENKEAIRVPTAYYKLETMAFVKKDSKVVIKSKEDLRKYRVFKVRGVKHTNNITKGMSNVKDLDSTEKLMRFLQGDRADVVLTNTVDGLIVLQRLGYTNIVPLKKPLAVLELYHYLHKTNKVLVPKVDAVIKRMKISGELDLVIKEAEKRVMKDAF